MVAYENVCTIEENWNEPKVHTHSHSHISIYQKLETSKIIPRKISIVLFFSLKWKIEIYCKHTRARCSVLASKLIFSSSFVAFYHLYIWNRSVHIIFIIIIIFNILTVIAAITYLCAFSSSMQCDARPMYPFSVLVCNCSWTQFEYTHTHTARDSGKILHGRSDIFARSYST